MSWRSKLWSVLQGFELHRLLTGRSSPNVVVFSNILWDLGRWLFLSELADTNEWACLSLFFHQICFVVPHDGVLWQKYHSLEFFTEHLYVLLQDSLLSYLPPTQFWVCSPFTYLGFFVLASRVWWFCWTDPQEMDLLWHCLKIQNRVNVICLAYAATIHWQFKRLLGHGYWSEREVRPILTDFVPSHALLWYKARQLLLQDCTLLWLLKKCEMGNGYNLQSSWLLCFSPENFENLIRYLSPDWKQEAESIMVCRTDYYGLPLLGDSEFIPVELLEEWRRDTHVQMQRIEVCCWVLASQLEAHCL